MRRSKKARHTCKGMPGFIAWSLLLYLTSIMVNRFMTRCNLLSSRRMSDVRKQLPIYNSFTLPVSSRFIFQNKVCMLCRGRFNGHGVVRQFGSDSHPFTVDLFICSTKFTQHVLSHVERNFTLTGEDCVCSSTT